MKKTALKPPSLLLTAVFVYGLLEFIGSGPAIADNVPSYATATVPSYATQEQTIHGRIASIDGQYRIAVHDDNGYLDNVALHQGTVINPTGLTLTPGMSVTILGYNGGSVFQANEIDTPYTYAGPRSTAYYGLGWSYPGFAFGYGYRGPRYYGPGWWYPGSYYGYGPSYGLRIYGVGAAWGYSYRAYRGYVRQTWPTRWPVRIAPPARK